MKKSEEEHHSVTPSPAEFIKTARGHLRKAENKEAYRILLQAMVLFPENPLILSYYGCLQAIVDRKYRSGIDHCRKALALFKAADMYTAGLVFPVLYLNLGRAHVAAGRKQDAVEAFSKGIGYDRGHRELKKELELLGIRKQPLLPFLSRSNPINKYIGILLHGAKKRPRKRSAVR